MRLLKRILLILLGVAVIGAIVYATLPKPVEVDVAEVERGSMTVRVEGDGQTRVRDRYEITSPLYGNLARIELDPGDDVEAGTVLARITPLEPPLLDARSSAELEARAKAAAASKAQSEAAVARAESSLDFAQRDLDRIRTLAAQGTLSQAELEQAELEAKQAAKALESARFGVRVARYELEMAKAAVGRVEDGRKGEKKKGKKPEAKDGEAELGPGLEIKAPLDGRILRIFREHEGVVNPGESLLELGDPSNLEIVVDVLTEDAVEIRPGAPVVIERWGGDERLHGRVRLVEPSAYTKLSALGVEEQRVNVIVDITEPPGQWEGLGDGYRVEVGITTWQDDDVIKVPAGALHRHGDRWATFVLEDEGVVREQTVEVGRRSGLEVEIVEGLEPGQTVIVYPSDRVFDGVEAVPRG